MQAATLVVERYSRVVLPTANDVPAIVDLLAAAPERCAPMSAAEVQKHLSSFRVIRDHETRQVVASISLQRIGLNTIELRCVTVASSARGQGLAYRLMDAALEELAPLRVRVVCATKIPDFFRRFGFEITTAIKLPRKRRSALACNKKRVTMVLANKWAETEHLRKRA